MRQLIFLLAILFVDVITYSQTTGFKYDNSGNRTSRTTTIGLKSTLGTSENVQSPDSFTDELGTHAILIYPNPVESDLIIEIQEFDENADAVIAIYDQGGRLVMTLDKIVSSNTINLSNLTYGTYFLTIRLGSDITRWTIVKE
jgi:YD repeat-containing protein